MVAEGVAAGGYQINKPLTANSPEAISAQFTFILTIPEYGGETVT